MDIVQKNIELNVPTFKSTESFHGSISQEPVGIRQASFNDALQVTSPHLRNLLLSAPIDHSNYTVDVKVHMLMKDQYPCIPGWHCDAVPRDGAKRLQYSKVDLTAKMFLWVSGPPLTTFLDSPICIKNKINDDNFLKDHSDLSKIIEATNSNKMTVMPQSWYEFNQLTPHKGEAATSHGWRLFVRMIDSKIFPPLARGQIIRTHSQVYLNADDFSW